MMFSRFPFLSDARKFDLFFLFSSKVDHNMNCFLKQHRRDQKLQKNFEKPSPKYSVQIRRFYRSICGFSVRFSPSRSSVFDEILQAWGVEQQQQLLPKDR